MIIKGIVRGKIDRRFTLLKRERARLGNIAKGDILLIKINDRILIRKILEDFIVSLPRDLPLKTNSEIEIEILEHVKPSKGLERSDIGFIGNLADLKHFIPLKTVHGKDMFIIDDKDKIFVWFARDGGLKLTHVKRFVDKEKLFEMIGFLWGDGSTEGVRSMRFTNGEPSTLVNSIEFFESIGIPRNMWKVQIVWNGNEISDRIKKECKNIWASRLNLPLENIKSVLWNKGKNRRNKFGCARIFIDNVILFEIFVNGILKWSKNEIQKEDPDEFVLKSLLRGIAAAESDIAIENNSIRRVGFSFDPHSDEFELFSSLLIKLGFRISEILKGRFCIDGWQNFLRLFLIDAFKLHEKKNKLFSQGFLNHRSTVHRKDKLRLLDKGLTRSEVANKLNLSLPSISSMCNTMVKDSLIVRKENKFELTSLSKAFLDKVQSLNKNLSN